MTESESLRESLSDHRNVGNKPPTRAPRAIRPLLILMVLANLAWSLYQLPLNRVVERRLCREYYLETDPSKIGEDGSVPEELCKLDSIQQGLGWTQGVMETTWIVGGKYSGYSTQSSPKH
jgi:hypothetical protein